jgi:hypothetical protein
MSNAESHVEEHGICVPLFNGPCGHLVKVLCSIFVVDLQIQSESHGKTLFIYTLLTDTMIAHACGVQRNTSVHVYTCDD